MRRSRSLPNFLDTEEIDNQVIDQFVENVEDFGSQYGSEISVNFTVHNLNGPPFSFPAYRDYRPRACVLRTYGPWWERQSAPKELPPQVNGKIQSHDFVEVSYETAVYPQKVWLFEAYNPGTLVRIWARGPTSWVLLWEGKPENKEYEPRVFSAPLKQVNFLTRILRLEFNHKWLPYHTEIDAIMLTGKDPTRPKTLKPKCKCRDELYLKSGKPLRKTASLLNLYTKFREISTSKSIVARVVEDAPIEDQFRRLPDEAILSVFKYLDVQSLCRCAQVNHQFCRIVSDPMLYKSVDLRPYWHCVRSEVLMALSTKCRYLKVLDLSWCGSHWMIEFDYVVSFLEKCGAKLRKLQMNGCQFVNDTVLEAIVRYAPNLEELSLRSAIYCSRWSVLKGLTKLTSLDLYKTSINTKAAITIIKTNRGLQHLNLGDCRMISAMDDVAHALAVNCPDLRTFDYWNSYSLTSRGKKLLRKCKKMEKVDHEWWYEATYVPNSASLILLCLELV